MHVITSWLFAAFTISGVAIPHWAPILFVCLAVLEYFLGRSKNPRLRSIAGYVMSGLTWLLKKTRVTDIPKVGDAITAILNYVAPPPTTNCTHCGGTGIEPPAVKPNV